MSATQLDSSAYDTLSLAAVRAGRWIVARGVATLLVIGATACLVALVWLTPSNLSAAPLAIQLGSSAVGIGFVVAGVVGSRQRPSSAVGPLLVIGGFLYLLGRLQGADPPVVWLLASAANALWQGVVYYIAFSFPAGRLATRIDATFVVVGLVYTAVNNAFVLITSPTRVAPGITSDNPTFIPLDAGIVTTTRGVLFAAGIVLIVTGSTWLVRRWLAASPPLRRALTPVYLGMLAVSTVALTLRLALGIVAPSTDPGRIISIGLLVAFGLVPIGFLIGVLRARIARGAVADIVLSLGDVPSPRQLQAVLVTALGDPTLEVFTWSSERAAFTAVDGRIMQVPEEHEGRAVTVLEGDEPAAVIVHDAALLNDPGLVASVGAAVRIALANERLEATVTQQLAELAASRGRIIAAADQARQGIERDIHDGAQQRLLAVRMALRSAAKRLGEDGREALGVIDRELGEAVADLRELARGVHPAVLTERGLGAGLGALARHSHVPVTLDIDLPAQRLRTEIESAAYFIAAGAVANAQAHAAASAISIRARVRRGALELRIEDDGIGGAVEGSGSGITNMRDRAEAVGGRLAVTSPVGGPTVVSATLSISPA